MCTHQYGQSHGHEIFWMADARALELDLCSGGFIDAEVVGSGGEHPWWFVAFWGGGGVLLVSLVLDCVALGKQKKHCCS